MPVPSLAARSKDDDAYYAPAPAPYRANRSPQAESFASDFDDGYARRTEVARSTRPQAPSYADDRQYPYGSSVPVQRPRQPAAVDYGDPFAPGGPCTTCSQPPPSFAPVSPYGAPGSCPWDQAYFFALAEGFRQDGGTDRVAGRFGLNWGMPIINPDWGLGFQIGGSGSVAETGAQFFGTTGLFYRGDMQYGGAFNIGAVADGMHDRAIDVTLAQVRGKASITIDEQNEIGVWGATGFVDDTANGVKWDTVDQANLFYRYLWPIGWDTTAWVGWRHGDRTKVAAGADWTIPVDDYWAFTGGGHYDINGDSWNAYVGVLIYVGGHARERMIGQHRYLPYLPVADNTSMTALRDR